ncbi:UNVERIFIED_CONTAM: hypothetical protein Scaly_1193100 [Sesamum calycinum]|uniref:Uncharacterized protein n=1 Tax=Sesamum calycinum TaxID=2727403 RepID=A0AAW2Q3C7_9LAMI
MAVRTGVLKAVLGLMAVCLAAYIVGPPLYWHLMEGLASASGSASCPPCNCDCDSLPLLSIPQAVSVVSLVGFSIRLSESDEETIATIREWVRKDM